MSEVELRAATQADAERIAAVTVEGFGTYRAFAPHGWTPPSTAEEVERLRRLLGQDYVWYLVATQAQELLGHVGFLPANRLQFAPSDDPGLVHFRQLFVVRAHWGTGLAAALHAAAVQEATARGFASMRLFTPADQARARRFYEREGWTLTRPPAFDERLGLDIAEYRRPLLQ